MLLQVSCRLQLELRLSCSIINHTTCSVSPQTLYRSLATIMLTLRTPVYRLCANFPVASYAGIPALRKLPCGVGSRHTGSTVCQRQASDAGIPASFSTADWHRHARVIDIQTRQQLKNNCFHETQRIFMNTVYRRNGMSTPGARSRYTVFVFYSVLAPECRVIEIQTR